MEDFLDFIQDHKWVRWIFFAVLLAVFWGNWNVMGVIVAVWAFYELVYWFTRHRNN